MVPVSTLGMGGGSLPVAPQVSGARKHRRGMRPAGGGRPLQQKNIDDLTNRRENAAGRPLSVEAAVFSLGPGPWNRVRRRGRVRMGGLPSVPSRLEE